jgi:hypothetical protein
MVCGNEAAVNEDGKDCVVAVGIHRLSDMPCALRDYKARRLWGMVFTGYQYAAGSAWEYGAVHCMGQVSNRHHIITTSVSILAPALHE